MSKAFQTHTRSHGGLHHVPTGAALQCTCMRVHDCASLGRAVAAHSTAAVSQEVSAGPVEVSRPANALTAHLTRRQCLTAVTFALTSFSHAAHLAPSAAAASPNQGLASEVLTLQEEAFAAYGERRFQDAVNALTQIIERDPASSRWYEMRAQALVDGKAFESALSDFNSAIALIPKSDLITRARLLSGRALAYEGVSRWQEALTDYQQALELALEGGESYDPYVVNSIGNCLNSLGRWADAREQYLLSYEIFQKSRGYRGRAGSTSPRLDGAVFSASNAALMLVQMGDVDGGVQEMVRVARRAPGSADMRAALAALYWARGQQQEAEEMWEFACDRITVGCTKYRDAAWLRTVRRWPPVMVDKLQDFLAVRKPSGAAPNA